jgi:tetratricopeptide (TPR) repeat protein
VEAAHEKIEHGHEQEAIDALKKLAAARPPAKGASRELGIAYYRTGILAEAEKSFAAAMAEDPDDADSVQMRGLTLYRLGRPGAALPFLETARQWTNASDVDVNYVLGRCYIAARRYDEARSAFAAQYNLDPESGASYLLIAQMLLVLEMPEIAAENAQKALRISPNTALAHFVIGKVYFARGDFGHALEQFERERSINPTYPPLYEFLGDLYTKMGQRRQAQHSLTEALSLDQSSTGPFILMGRLFLDDNDPQTAVIYLQHAEQMDSSNFITHYLLGQAYKKMGKTEDAKRELDVVSKIHSGEIK